MHTYTFSIHKSHGLFDEEICKSNAKQCQLITCAADSARRATLQHHSYPQHLITIKSAYEQHIYVVKLTSTYAALHYHFYPIIVKSTSFHRQIDIKSTLSNVTQIIVKSTFKHLHIALHCIIIIILNI